MNEDLAKQFSDILKDKNIDISQLLEQFSANSSDKNTENKNNNSDQIDAKTLLQFQKLFHLLNQKTDNKDEQLLRSLKPYLRDSKKEKIDTYIKILHIMKLFEKFQQMGENLNDFF